MSLEKLNNIPDELKNLKQWVCWTIDKLPKNAYTGKNAQSNNPKTWAYYDEALDACKKFNFNGVGFMFANGYFGVDLDAHHGQTLSKELIDEFTSTLNSYAEYSKSGEGIHIICKGRLPEGARRKGQIEMYDTGRYFIMTGNIIDNYTNIIDCNESIKVLHSKYLSNKQKPLNAQKNTPNHSVDLDEQQIIDKARASKTGQAFQLLYSGAWEGVYPSHSEADMAFANMLAFWCGADFYKMDSIFRASGLYREKWERVQSGSTYGALTLQRAIDNCSQVYDPKKLKDDDLPKFVIDRNGEVVKTKKKYELTDTGNGERFADFGNDFIKYNSINNCWLIWTGKYWSTDTTKYIKVLQDICVKDMVNDISMYDDEAAQKAYFKWCMQTQSSAKKKAMLEEASHLLNISCSPVDFDKHNDLLNCENGTINLRNGEIIEHQASLMQSKLSKADISFDKPKLWLKFLGEMTCGDVELQLYLQKAMGYTLTGLTTEQCVFFCYGMGGNGKGVFLDTISEIMADYSANVQPELFMSSKLATNQETQLARLKGVRLVTSQEFKEGLLNETLIKQLSGGGAVTARHLYGSHFEFEPSFKIWITTNDKPIIKGTDNGIWRRMRIIPFLADIPKEKMDKNLKEKLKAEYHQILGWLIEGAMLWYKEGLDNVPKCILDATDEYRKEMDILSQFLETNCVDTMNALCSANDLFKMYISWARQNNEYEMSKTKFGREMAKKYKKKKTNKGIVYEGVFLKDNVKKFMA